MTKLLRVTCVPRSDLEAIIVSGGAWPFILAGGRRSAVMVCRWLAGTAVALSIPSLSWTVAAVAGRVQRNSAPSLCVFCFFFLLAAVAVAVASFIVRRSAD